MELKKIEYSQKALAVIGQTFEIKDELSAMNGRFNRFLTCGPGWIFPKTKEAEIDKLIHKYTIKVVCEGNIAKPVKKRNYNLLGVPKEAVKLLSNQPGCLEEAVIHFFLNGGRVKTAQLQKELGYKSYKDLKTYFGMYSAEGVSMDLLYEQPEFDGVRYTNQIGRDFIDSIIEVLIHYPTKRIMADRLIKLSQTEDIWAYSQSMETENVF